MNEVASIPVMDYKCIYVYCMYNSFYYNGRLILTVIITLLSILLD